MNHRRFRRIRRQTEGMALLAACLSRRMREAGLSQERLEAASGVSQTTISFILRGMCAPNIDTIWRLARGLGLAPHEFLKP